MKFIKIDIIKKTDVLRVRERVQMSSNQTCYTIGFLIFKYCYKLIQRFRVTCLFTGQCTTKTYGTITDVI